MAELDLKFSLLLAYTYGIGPVKYRKLIEKFSDYESFMANGTPELLQECGLSEKQINYLRNYHDWQRIDKIIEQANNSDVKIISLGSADYPDHLSNIYSPPIVLYVKGQHDLLGKPAVAIVGSRTPTDYGRMMAGKIASGLAAHGLVIVSGMALGIDAEAHRAALTAGGTTGAVFGNGIDIIYPPDHRDLADKISQQGFLISEFPFGTDPDRHNFPRRNRIISGLSLAVVVVEAASRSGALVTADLAIEQGKDVFAVPGQADSPRSDGTISLIKQGAYVATSADDILQTLGWEVGANKATDQPVPEPVKLELEPDESKVCDLIAAGPLHFDELVRNLNLPSSKLSAILLKLELAGVVVRRPGNYLTRA
jgi:DNA processing protein